MSSRNLLLCLVSTLLLLAGAAGAEEVGSPVVDVAYARGVVALSQQRFEEAAEQFRRVLAAEPEHLGAAQHYGVCLVELERYDEALDVLEPAAARAPDDHSLQLDLGVAYLRMGNVAFAVRALGRVVEGAPESARAHLALGLALASQRDCELAAEELLLARQLDPELTLRTRYAAGICHVLDGELERSREELEPIARSPLDEPMVDRARRFVRLALRAEGIETQRLSVNGAVGALYDSNPTLAQDGSPRLHSIAPVFQGDLTLRVVANEAHTLAGGLSFYRSFYFPEQAAADYNETHLGASVYYQLRTVGAGVRHRLQIGYDFALGFFDGEPPLADEHHIFSEVHGLRALWSVRETDELLTRVTLLARANRFALRRRNNLGITIGIGQAVAIPRLGMQLYFEATMRVEEAESLDYDVIAPGALVSLSVRLPWELVLASWFLYEHELHPGSSEDRVDVNLLGSVALEREIIRHLAIQLAWVHNESISTVERFDYGRDMLSLNVWGRY